MGNLDKIFLNCTSLYFLATTVLKLCDELRDDILPVLGVRLEDQEGKINLELPIFLICTLKILIKLHFIITILDFTYLNLGLKAAIKLVDPAELAREKEIKQRVRFSVNIFKYIKMVKRCDSVGL